MTVDQTSWENIPPRTPGHMGEARARIQHVLDNDPFARMFSTEIRECMIDGFLLALRSGPYTKVEDGLETHTHKDVSTDLNRVMRLMPLGFVTDDFKTHLVSLVTYALIPKPERDEFYTAL